MQDIKDYIIEHYHNDQQWRLRLARCKTAVLAGAARPGLVAAGLFAPEVDMFDPRCGREQVAAYRAHSRSIMALAIVNDFIISASEDQTLSVWDLTAGKIFKSGIQVG